MKHVENVPLVKRRRRVEEILGRHLDSSHGGESQHATESINNNTFEDEIVPKTPNPQKKSNGFTGEPVSKDVKISMTLRSKTVNPVPDFTDFFYKSDKYEWFVTRVVSIAEDERIDIIFTPKIADDFKIEPITNALFIDILRVNPTSPIQNAYKVTYLQEGRVENLYCVKKGTQIFQILTDYFSDKDSLPKRQRILSLHSFLTQWLLYLDEKDFRRRLNTYYEKIGGFTDDQIELDPIKGLSNLFFAYFEPLKTDAVLQMGVNRLKAEVRLLLSFLNLLAVEVAERDIGNVALPKFDDVDVYYLQNVKSLATISKNILDFQSFVNQVTREWLSNQNYVPKEDRIPMLEASVNELLTGLVQYSGEYLSRERKANDVERENAILKRSLFIERSKKQGQVERRKESFETIVKQECAIILDCLQVPSIKFAVMVSGYLAMMYTNAVVKIDYASYIINRLRDAPDNEMLENIMTDPYKARLRFETDELLPGVTYETYLTSTSPPTTDFGKLIKLVYSELMIFKHYFDEDKRDTHNQAINILTPMIFTARMTAWGILRHLLMEGSQNSKNGSEWSQRVDNMKWIFNPADKTSQMFNLQSLFAKLTAAKFTEAQLSKGHTTEKDKVERILITDSIEMELRVCLREMGLHLAENAFKAAFARR